MTLQPKLLRFLETRRARRVGSTKEYHCRVRVISATNRELEVAVDHDLFRRDLYYRLAEVMLHIPPLRHRSEDIPDLIRIFIRDSAERLGKNFESIEPELILKFQQYRWPGNVRELKQAIDRLSILYDGPVIRSAWWEPSKGRGHSEMPRLREHSTQNFGRDDGDGREFGRLPRGRVGLPSRVEKMALARELLEQHGHDLTWVAAQLGVHPTTLYRWRKAGKV